MQEISEELKALLEDEEHVAGGDSDNPGLRELVDEAIQLKTQIELVESDLTVMRQRFDDIRKRQLPDLMATLGLIGPDGKARFTHVTGARVHLTNTVHARVTKADEDAFFTWLRDHGHDGLIKETVHPSTLKAFAKELIEAGEALPPQVLTHLETTAVFTLPKQGEKPDA